VRVVQLEVDIAYVTKSGAASVAGSAVTGALWRTEQNTQSTRKMTVRFIGPLFE